MGTKDFYKCVGLRGASERSVEHGNGKEIAIKFLISEEPWEGDDDGENESGGPDREVWFCIFTMLEMSEGKSGEENGKADQGSCFGQESKSDQGTDRDGEFEVPALLDSPNCKGKNPGDNGIEEWVVADGAVESDIHGKECGESSCGKGDFFAAKSPDSGEVDAEKGCESDDGIEKSQAKSGIRVGWVGSRDG